MDSPLFANPHSQGLIFPLEYGQSLNHTTDSIRIAIHNKGSTVPYTLVFRPYQSLLIQLGSDNKISIVDIYFKPKTPVYINGQVLRGRNGKCYLQNNRLINLLSILHEHRKQNPSNFMYLSRLHVDDIFIKE